MILSWRAAGTAKDGSAFVLTGMRNIREGAVHISADLPEGTITSVTGKIIVPIRSREHIFMNGFQTWTYCPEYTKDSRIRGLNGTPAAAVRRFALNRYGDYHFVKYPNKKGYLHGFSWCTFRYKDQYRIFASTNEKPGYTIFRYNSGTAVLSLKRDCEGIVCGGKYPLFDLYIADGTEDEVYDGWFEKLDLPPVTKEKLFGYSSWYNRYQDISEAAIHQDLQGCKKIFKKGDLFQIDDGWEPFIGDWLESDHKKFPGGMKAQADKIHQAGFKAGLWIAPFVAEEKSAVYQNHPDWFFKVNGKPWKCGSNWSGFYSLDIDNPEVKDYLKEVFRQIREDWGFDLIKADFLYGAAPFGTEDETRAGRMIRAMKFLRTQCGDMKILGCGVPVMPAFGYVDYCRISCDVSLDWDDKPHMRIIHRERVSTKQAIGNTLSRRALNGRAYLSDPDVFFLRESNLSLSEDRKEMLAKLDALMGGVFLTSDDPGSYTNEIIYKYQVYRHIAEDAVNVRYLPDKHMVRYEIDGAERFLQV